MLPNKLDVRTGANVPIEEEMKPKSPTAIVIIIELETENNSRQVAKEINDMDQFILEIVLESQQKIKEILSKHSINDLALGKHK